MMRCVVLTLFPDMVAAVLGQSMLNRAQEKGLLQARPENLRDHTSDRHKTADDVPYGGGPGMVMKAGKASERADKAGPRVKVD